MYFGSELNKVESVFNRSNKNIFWIKFGENFLNNKSNTHIACVYNKPKKSTYTKKINAKF